MSTEEQAAVENMSQEDIDAGDALMNAVLADQQGIEPDPTPEGEVQTSDETIVTSDPLEGLLGESDGSSSDLNKLINADPKTLTREEKRKRNGTIKEQFIESEAELDTALARIAELEQLADTGRSSYEEMETNYKSAQEKLKANEKILNSRDPNSSPDVIALDESFSSKAAKAVAAFPDLQNNYSPLLQAFAQLPHGTEQYAESLREFKSKLSEVSPDYEGQESVIIGYLQEGVEYHRERQKQVDAFAENSDKILYEHNMNNFNKLNENFNSRADSWFKPVEGIEKTHPDDATYLISQMIQTDDGLNNYSKKVDKFLRDAFEPDRPMRAEDFADLSVEDAAKKIQESREIKSVANQRIQDKTGQAFMALKILPELSIRLKNAEDRLAAISDSNPPPPNTPDNRQTASGNDEESTYISSSDLNRQIMSGQF